MKRKRPHSNASIPEPTSSPQADGVAGDPFSDSKGAKRQKHAYALEKIEIKNSEYKDETPEHLQNQDIPGFPSTVVLIGRPGSGKTNLLMNLLTRKEFYFGFFDVIYALGPTVNSDKLYKTIQIQPHNKVTEVGEFIPKVIEWTEAQVDAVKNNPEEATKVLFIFEDITSYRHTIQNNPNFVKCFTTIRHHKATVIALVHKFAALERTCRMNCMHVIVFPVNWTDIKNLYKDYGTDDLDEQDFRVLCQYAWKKTEDCEKPFLYINMYAPVEDRFRKCFTEIIPADEFRGAGKALKKEGLESRKRKSMAPRMDPMKDDTKSKVRDETISPSVFSSSSSSSISSSSGGGMGPPPPKKPKSVMDNVFSYVR